VIARNPGPAPAEPPQPFPAEEQTMTEETEDPPTLGSPDPDRGGPTVDAAVANAESGSQVEGVHTPSGKAASGDSRVEQMTEVTEPPEE
jgi:hypothetical protein